MFGLRQWPLLDEFDPDADGGGGEAEEDILDGGGEAEELEEELGEEVAPEVEHLTREAADQMFAAHTADQRSSFDERFTQFDAKIGQIVSALTQMQRPQPAPRKTHPWDDPHNGSANMARDGSSTEFADWMAQRNRTVDGRISGLERTFMDKIQALEERQQNNIVGAKYDKDFSAAVSEHGLDAAGESLAKSLVMGAYMSEYSAKGSAFDPMRFDAGAIVAELAAALGAAGKAGAGSRTSAGRSQKSKAATGGKASPTRPGTPKIDASTPEGLDKLIETNFAQHFPDE